MEYFTPEQLRAACDSGGLLAVTLEADESGYEVAIETKSGPAKLAISNGKTEPRLFIDARHAIELLLNLGVQEKLINWSEPHSSWLTRKLEVAATDTRPRVSHEQVMADAQAIIDRKRS